MGELTAGAAPYLFGLAGLLVGAAGLALLVHLTARQGGLFRFFPFAVLLSVAGIVLVSGRTLQEEIYALPAAALHRLASPVSPEARALLQAAVLEQANPVATWINRLCSSFLILASLERIASYVFRRNRSTVAPNVPLAIAFVIFWCTTVASPALFGAEGSFEHEYIYTLPMGLAALLLSQREGEAVVDTTLIALIAFLAIGIALTPVRASLVIEPTYTGGFLPGVPRFAGLAPHAVSLGMLAELALLCLYARPFASRWLNRLCWAFGLCALILAQSKMSWLSFPFCLACIFWFRNGEAAWRTLTNLRRRSSSLATPLVLLGLTAAAGVIYVFSSGRLTADWFLAGRGSDIASLTGRDQIWAVALQEWARHPIFGYGTDLFDARYRFAIRMMNAQDAHNELFDTLARSGLVGAAGLTLYGAVLLFYSVKHARSTQGLSLALFMAIAFRSVSEVPLKLFGYGPDVVQHLVLLAILPGMAQVQAIAARQKTFSVSAAPSATLASV